MRRESERSEEQHFTCTTSLIKSCLEEMPRKLVQGHIVRDSPPTVIAAPKMDSRLCPFRGFYSERCRENARVCNADVGEDAVGLQCSI